MKTLAGILLITFIFGGCSKDFVPSPDRSNTRQLAKKGSYLAVKLYKDGVLQDETETLFSGNPGNGTLEPFDRDITISFLESGAYWQTNNLRNKKADTLQLSILHKEQVWCSHCTYYNGNYSLIFESKVKATLVDKVLGVKKPISKNQNTTYNYAINDNSDQADRFVILIK